MFVVDGREYLNNREQDLWCGGAQGHECQVGHGFIPDPHGFHRGFPIRFGNGHLLLLIWSFQDIIFT